MAMSSWMPWSELYPQSIQELIKFILLSMADEVCGSTSGRWWRYGGVELTHSTRLPFHRCCCGPIVFPFTRGRISAVVQRYKPYLQATNYDVRIIMPIRDPEDHYNKTV